MLHLGVPWQWAERDPEYYSRTLPDLGSPALWYDWKADCIGRPGFVPMVWRPALGSQYTRMLQVAQHAPRQLWLLGNEPERAEQANVSPHEFAQAIRTWLALVGGQWAGPGILWGDGGRAWLDAYLRIGGPVPDVWAMHIYGSPDIDGWLAQYNHALRFLAERQVLRRVWITETNGGEALLRYLAASSGITAFWYADRDPFGDNSAYDLHDERGQLTHLGRVFASLQGTAAAGADAAPRAWMPIMRG